MAATSRIQPAPRGQASWLPRPRFGGKTVANALVLLGLLAWYLYSLTVPEFVIPNPIKVLRQTVALFVSPDLAQHTYISLVRVLVSVLVSLIIGGALVLVARYVPLLETFIGGRVIPFLNSFPSLGWAMVAIIWFGVNNLSVMFVETAILLPFAMINIWEGLKALDGELLEMASSFTRDRRKVLTMVITPMLFPYIFSALRVSYGVGWKVALVSELFGAHTGLGYLLNVTRQNFDTSTLFAIIVAIIILVFVVDKLLFQSLERRLTRWRV